MKITERNIHLVAHRLKKQVQSGLTSQHFYPQSKRRNNLLKRLGIKEVKGLKNFDKYYNVEESNICVFEKVKIETDFCSIKNQPYIRVHNDASGGWLRVFLIEVGDDICFNNKIIKHKCQYPTKEEKCIHVIKFD